MKIHFRTPPVSKRLHGWQRIARCVKNALQSTLIIEAGYEQRRQDPQCIAQSPGSHASLRA